jgi:hypothetical protein
MAGNPAGFGILKIGGKKIILFGKAATSGLFLCVDPAVS